MDSPTATAFFDVIRDARLADAYHVSLYLRCPFYGGPEEGGWWGEDVVLIATQQFRVEVEARNSLEAVEQLAERLSEESRRNHDRLCDIQSDYCEDRGVDDSNLLFGEVDGHGEYFVVLESQIGSHAHVADRTYQ